METHVAVNDVATRQGRLGAGMHLRQLTNMRDVDMCVRLASLMASEGNFATLQFDPDKVRMLGARCLSDPREQTMFLRMAMKNGELIGMMVGYIGDYHFSPQLIANDIALYVHPDHRGGSAASRLLKQFIEWAQGHEVHEICLGVSVGVNDELVGRLYRKFGFEEVGSIYKRRNM